MRARICVLARALSPAHTHAIARAVMIIIARDAHTASLFARSCALRILRLELELQPARVR